MIGFSEIGKMLIFLGAILLVVGVLLTFFPTGRLGKLPGDIVIRRENWSLYVPITTGILLSLVLTLALWALHTLRR